MKHHEDDPWSPEGREEKQRFRFTGTPGVRNFPNGEFTPINIFKLFLTDELVQHITDATNSYAQIKIYSPEIQEKIRKIFFDCSSQ